MNENWRLDASAHSNVLFSIKYATTHEIGHALGLGHDSNSSSVLYASASPSYDFHEKYPNGLKYSMPEREAIEAVYGEGWGYQKDA